MDYTIELPRTKEELDEYINQILEEKLAKINAEKALDETAKGIYAHSVKEIKSIIIANADEIAEYFSYGPFPLGAFAYHLIRYTELRKADRTPLKNGTIAWVSQVSNAISSKSWGTSPFLQQKRGVYLFDKSKLRNR